MTPGRRAATTGADDGPTKGERTRARLVDVAARVFAERGYVATTFGELIEAAGVSKGAFYFHYRSKEELALAVLEQVKGRHLEAFRARLAQGPGDAGPLRAMADAFLALTDDEPAGSITLAHELASSLAASPEVRAEAAAVTRRWLDLVAGVVADAQRAGDVRASLDPTQVARVLFAAVDGLRRLVDSLDDPGVRRDVFAVQLGVLVEILEQGLGPSPVRHGTSSTACEPR